MKRKNDIFFILLLVLSFLTNCEEFNPNLFADDKYIELMKYGMDRKAVDDFYSIEKYKSNTDIYIKALKLEINSHPNNYKAYDLLADVLQDKQKDINEAEKNYKISLLANPRGYHALYRLGNIYLIKKDIENAQNIFNKLINTNLTCPEGYLGLGIVYIAQKEYMLAFNKISSAKEYYRRLDSRTYPDLALQKNAKMKKCDEYLRLIKNGAIKNYKEVVSEEKIENKKEIKEEREEVKENQF